MELIHVINFSVSFLVRDEWLVDIVYDSADLYEYWLYNKRYGVKMFMFSFDFGSFISAQEHLENINDLDDYIKIYTESYMSSDIPF